MSDPRPERVAAAARAGQAALLELVALRCEAIVEELGEALGMVAWDARRVIGKAQRELRALEGERFAAPFGGPPVRVIERAGQPLECLAVAWRHLRQGLEVHVGGEAGAPRSGLGLLVAFVPRLEGALRVSPPGEAGSAEAAGWAEVGVERALPRLAVVADDGDRELAAYVLARTALRRAGADPRGVKQALVCGPMLRLERHLQRLWVGAIVGPASDPEAFAGPASPALAAVYADALARWSARAEVEVLCAGGEVERGDRGGPFLAPALLRVPWPPPPGMPTPGSEALPLCGPMLVLHPCPSEHVLGAIEAIGVPAARQLWVGAPPLGARGEDGRRFLRGALLVERVPPGLPDPRPV